MKEEFTIIAGPCAVESLEQMREVAKFLKSKGIKYLRAGAYKPRTSPDSFQGLREEGIEILKKIKEELELKIITEVVDTRDVEKISTVADILQIGARNMQNYELLKEVGKTKKQVLLKRGLSATINEWENAAKYIEKEGGTVIFCERGIRTFETKTRNTLDISAVPIIQKETKNKVLVDPSHAAGRKDLIKPLSIASKAIGADGLIIEVHPNPKEALSDGAQSLNLEEFKELLESLKKV